MKRQATARRGRRAAWVLMAAVLLAGCATTIPQAIRQAPPGDLGLGAARTDLKLHVGERVRWGGTLVKVENQAHDTLLEVVGRPLRDDGRPEAGAASPGRFLVQAPGFLDPAVYETGREITVAGTLAGETTQTIGEYVYTLPVVHAQELYLWPPPAPPAPPGYYYGSPFMNPWYPWGPWGPGYPYYPY